MDGIVNFAPPGCFQVKLVVVVVLEAEVLIWQSSCPWDAETSVHSRQALLQREKAKLPRMSIDADHSLIAMTNYSNLHESRK
jgi:hypothetical protein